jgi:hypothetical protein
MARDLVVFRVFISFLAFFFLLPQCLMPPSPIVADISLIAVGDWKPHSHYFLSPEENLLTVRQQMTPTSPY